LSDKGPVGWQDRSRQPHRAVARWAARPGCGAGRSGITRGGITIKGALLRSKAKRLNERLVYRALALDGTCTGEHGIGCGKIEFLLAEHGEAVSVMRAIKRAIDPDNIMNPGKILEV
jgi:FAD linked oxidases, C-terminal domain